MRLHQFFILMVTLSVTSCSDGPSINEKDSSLSDHPNVVIVITDDQGYGDIGRNGNPILQTPAIDQFAENSIRLTDFHVDPTCSPTRAALMTGQHSMRAGVWHTIMGRSLLPTEKVTLAEHFKAAGYRTGLFGKWHLGDNAPYRPEDQGFDAVIIHGGGGVGQTPDYWGNTQFDDTYFVNGAPIYFEGNSTDVWFDEAERFLSTTSDEPSLAIIALNAPHRPWRAPEDYVSPYRDKGLPEPVSQFYGMITHLDQRFGQIVDMLTRPDQARETIIVFMSDNGSALNYSKAYTNGQGLALFDGIDDSWIPNSGMRGFKASVYEGGHRVPFYMRVPGQSEGRDVDTLSAHYDLLPTLIDLAGIDATLDTDGRSLAPLVSGEVDELEPRPIIVTNQRVFNPSFNRPMAVLDGNWRLIVFQDENVRELYDLSRDPDQSDNVIDQFPDRADRMMALLEDWWASFDQSVDANLISLGLTGEPVRLTAMDWMEAASTDDVPWFPGHDPREGEPPYPQWIGKEDRYAPLPWYLDVADSGNYKVTLRLHDAPGNATLARSFAIVELNGKRTVKAIDPATDEATLTVKADEGFTKLRTFLSNDPDAVTGRPAFFVYIDAVK